MKRLQRTRNFSELSPTDRVSLYHGRLIARYEQVIKSICIRAMAMDLAKPRRYVELAEDIRDISSKEYRRICGERKAQKRGKR